MTDSIRGEKKMSSAWFGRREKSIERRYVGGERREQRRKEIENKGGGNEGKGKYFCLAQ